MSVGDELRPPLDWLPAAPSEEDIVGAPSAPPSAGESLLLESSLRAGDEAMVAFGERLRWMRGTGIGREA